MKLKIARMEQGLSQVQLAEMTDVTRQTIGMIEAGDFNPSLKPVSYTHLIPVNLCNICCKSALYSVCARFIHWFPSRNIGLNLSLIHI